MAVEDKSTTLLCLFHHQDQAEAAYNDLLKAGVAPGSISSIHSRSSAEATVANLRELGVPEQDEQHLLESLRGGGSILVVETSMDHVGAVERIFGDHRATKIGEALVDGTGYVPPAIAGVAVEKAIPIDDEELIAGKRTVDQSDVRSYRRVIEVPVEEPIQLREQRVPIERRPIDRVGTKQDHALRGEQTIELTETAEEAVISKSVHVVEEVRIGKEASERTERVRGTVRHTEVEVKEVAPADSRAVRESVAGTTRS